MGSLVSWRWDTRRRRELALALVLSIAALFLNPVGLKQILYPVNTLLHQPTVTGYIQEWQPLQLNTLRGFAWLATLGGISLLVITRRAELFWHELLLLALGAWLAASHERMLFVFGILAAPILTRLLSTAWEGYDRKHDLPWANAGLIAASLLFAFWVFPSHQNLQAQVQLQSPVKAVEFIQDHHLSGPMLNEFVYGGYLIWAAPEHPVFVDGRADIFDWTGVLVDYGNWATLQSDPRALLDKYSINFCLLGSESPMTHVLPLSHEWKLVYADDTSVVFVRTTATNAFIREING
jgi:hypothetical protein